MAADLEDKRWTFHATTFTLWLEENSRWRPVPPRAGMPTTSLTGIARWLLGCISYRSNGIVTSHIELYVVWWKPLHPRRDKKRELYPMWRRRQWRLHVKHHRPSATVSHDWWSCHLPRRKSIFFSVAWRFQRVGNGLASRPFHKESHSHNSLHSITKWNNRPMLLAINKTPLDIEGQMITTTLKDCEYLYLSPQRKQGETPRMVWPD